MSMPRFARVPWKYAIGRLQSEGAYDPVTGTPVRTTAATCVVQGAGAEGTGHDYHDP